jgi:sec-independent protein translocase protein TatC
MSDDDDSNKEKGLADGPEDDQPMSFFDHLKELRKRLVRSALGVTAAFIVCYATVNHIRALVLRPYYDAWIEVGMEGDPRLQTLSALEAFLTDLRIAIIAAIFVAGPIVFYHLWMFVSPGLYKQEKKLVVPFVATSAFMFAGGAVFCYYLVLPIATRFFLEYALSTGEIEEAVAIVPNFRYSDYVTYSTRLLLGFGAMFEFPLGVFFLAKAGIITHKTLLRYWKIMVLVFFIVGALLTPPEPITQILMATPMIGLYFISIGVAYVVSKPELERIAKLDAELAAEEEETAGEAGDDSADSRDSQD